MSHLMKERERKQIREKGLAALIERTKKLQEESQKKMSDYEKAVWYLKAHASTVESEERLLRFIEGSGAQNPKEILNRLISERKIRRYTRTDKYDLLKLVSAKYEGEESRT